MTTASLPTVERLGKLRVVLRPWLIIWTVAVAIDGMSLSLTMTLRPEWYRSTSYDFAREVFPLQSWGLVFGLVSVLAVAGLAGSRPKLIRTAFALHAIAHVAFAVSIFALTWTGSLGAFAGSVRWLLVGAVSTAWASSAHLTTVREER